MPEPHQGLTDPPNWCRVVAEPHRDSGGIPLVAEGPEDDPDLGRKPKALIGTFNRIAAGNGHLADLRDEALGRSIRDQHIEYVGYEIAPTGQQTGSGHRKGHGGERARRIRVDQRADVKHPGHEVARLPRQASGEREGDKRRAEPGPGRRLDRRAAGGGQPFERHGHLGTLERLVAHRRPAGHESREIELTALGLLEQNGGQGPLGGCLWFGKEQTKQMVTGIGRGHGGCRHA